MERLTEINERGEGIDCYPKSRWPLGFVIGQEHPLYDIARKLAEYEDLEEQGKLLKLPVPAESFVYEPYQFMGEGTWKIDVHKIRLEDLDKIGETVFLTHDEAEEALKRMEEGK